MSLRVPPIGPVRALEQGRLDYDATLRRIASAKRITRASDDAAGLAISEQLHMRDRSLQQGVRNLSDGLSAARTADGGLAAISENLLRMQELAVQSGNGALGSEAQQAIQSEYEQLKSEIDRIAGATRFADRALLNGDSSGEGAVHLRDGSDSGNVVEISLGDHSAAALGLAGSQASDPDALARINAARATTSSTRASLGAVEQRLDSGIRNLQSQGESAAAAGSRIRDADMARETAELAKQQLLAQVRTATAAQARISSRYALELLQGKS